MWKGINLSRGRQLKDRTKIEDMQLQAHQYYQTKGCHRVFFGMLTQNRFQASFFIGVRTLFVQIRNVVCWFPMKGQVLG